jgi:antitoxin (DNA-binding transcriptional repressor) of toxin-antitoxin stability system
MKTMTVGEFKTRFSEVIEEARAGVKVAVTYGKKKKIVGYFVPEIEKSEKNRKLGLLEGKARAIFKPEFKITDKELLGL